MKLGFIVECGPSGADAQVIPHLAKKIDVAAEIAPVVTLNSKANLLPQCGPAAKVLLEQGCERVLILWDIMPRWGEKERPHCHHGVASARRSLGAAGVDEERVRLLCFENELEAWIAADERAISAVLSRPAHPVSFRRIKNPHTHSNIKGHLEKSFENCKCSAYQDLTHALRIVQNLPDLTRLRRIPSFQRFEMLILDRNSKCSRIQS